MSCVYKRKMDGIWKGFYTPEALHFPTGEKGSGAEGDLRFGGVMALGGGDWVEDGCLFKSQCFKISNPPTPPPTGNHVVFTHR